MLDRIETLAMFARAHQYISEATDELVAALTGRSDADSSLVSRTVPEDLRATLVGIQVTDPAAEALGYLVRGALGGAFFKFASLLDGFDAPEGFEDAWTRVELTRAPEDTAAPFLHDAFCAAAGAGWKHSEEQDN